MINLQDYIVSNSLFKTIEIDDLLMVEYKCLVEEARSEIWTHTSYLAYVLGGEKKWKTAGHEITVGTGQALFVKKGANTVYQYFDEPFLVLFVFIPDGFIRQVIQKHPDVARHAGNGRPAVDHPLIPVSLNNVIASFFNSLMSFFSQGATAATSVLKLKMEELVLDVLTQPGNDALKQYFRCLGDDQKTDIERIMNANYTEPLSLNDYARLCARSPSTFQRDFKRMFGVTPGKWLIAKRLEYSRFLLETTGQQINEVVYNSGFKNRAHFIKAFKQAFGTSPNKYRMLKAAPLA